MSDEKLKRNIKPKFAPPVSEKSRSMDGKVNTDERHEKHHTVAELFDPVSVRPDSNSTEKDSGMVTISPGKRPSAKRSLTDSQYEDLFRSVTDHILSGEFLDACEYDMTLEDEQKQESKKAHKSKHHRKKSKKLKKSNCDVTPTVSANDVEMTDTSISVKSDNTVTKADSKKDSAADAFTKIVSSTSPNLTKRTNEVTPNTSPLEEGAESLLTRAPEPKKEKSMEQKEKRKTGKRKSLGYQESKKSATEEPLVAEAKSTEQITPSPRKKAHQVKGTWVQCVSCIKWRYLAGCGDPASLHDQWICAMNPEKEFAVCSVPEAEWEEMSQESYIYTQFTPGSIVWAKITGYPSWPAMVDTEPDSGSFYEKFPDGSVSHYHVVFLDEQVSRAWVSYRNIEPFREDETPVKLPKKSRNREYMKELESACRRGSQALKVEIHERIAKYGFQQRYRGKTKWNLDKDVAEKRARKAVKKQSKKLEKKTDIVQSGKNEHMGDDKNVDGDKLGILSRITCDEKEQGDDEYVSGTDSEDDRDYWNKTHDDENVDLFSGMVIDENPIGEEVLPEKRLGDTVENQDRGKGLELNSEIYTMETGKECDVLSEPIDLSQKKNSDQRQVSEDVPLDLSGRKSSSDSLTYATPKGKGVDEVLMDAGETDVLLQDLGFEMDGDPVENGESSEVKWEEFDQLVMME